MLNILKSVTKQIVLRPAFRFTIIVHGIVIRLRKTLLTEHVIDTAGDNVPAEIEYRDPKGRVVGFWAYGCWHPDYPYQG